MVLSALLACRTPAPPTPPPTVTLTIAALNDWHGGLYESPIQGDDRVYGGLPWLAAAVRNLRAEHPDLLLLDGGDEFEGSWPVNQTRGRGAVQAFDLLGVDAAAVGNHEFDYGGLPGADPLRGALETAVAGAKYPFLAANVYRSDGTRWGPPNVDPWTTIERDGLKIGVVGLSTATTPTVTNPKNVADLTFRDPVEEVRALLPELDAADLDVRVLVAHLTGQCRPTAFAKDDDASCTPDGEIGRLLTELPEGTFDVMVLGHAHTLLAHRVGRTFLLEDRTLGQLLGRLDLVVGPNGVDPDASVLHDPWALGHAPADPGCTEAPYPTEPRDVGGVSLAPDPEAVALVEALEREAGSLCDRLTCASRPLFRSEDGESELGDWLADATRAAFADVDVGVQNAGGIRADLPQGDVRREQIQRLMPFDNQVLLVEMTGAQVREMLRIGSAGVHGLLQVSGASYRVDPSRTGQTDLDGDGQLEGFERDRLCPTVTVGGKPLDDARTYRVAVSDFLFGGGDDLGPAFAGAKVVDRGGLLRDRFYDQAAKTAGCIGDSDPPPRITVGPCTERR